MYWAYMNHSHISSFSKTAFLPSTAFPHSFPSSLSHCWLSRATSSIFTCCRLEPWSLLLTLFTLLQGEEKAACTSTWVTMCQSWVVIIIVFQSALAWLLGQGTQKAGELLCGQVRLIWQYSIQLHLPLVFLKKLQNQRSAKNCCEVIQELEEIPHN